MTQGREDPEAPDDVTQLQLSLAEVAEIQLTPLVKELAAALQDAGVPEEQIYPRAFMSIELAMSRVRETFHLPHTKTA